MKPKRIQRKRTKGWQMPDGAVCVTRGTKWGNPFVVGKHGTRAECLYLYRAMLQGYMCISQGFELAQAQIAYREAVREQIGELRGKDLACWCPLDKPCHADVLLEVANSEEKL